MSTTTVKLARGGGHDCGQDEEGCLFEWYNWLTHQHVGDDCPPGVSAVLHKFGMSLNDVLPDGKRQELARFLPNGTSPLAGTAGDGKDETRGYLALDWLVRTYLPAWLELAGIDTAGVLRGQARVDTLERARLIGPLVRSARDKAAAAVTAAVAVDVAVAAARDAAWTAAVAAARDAAVAAAWTAAWDAAVDAAGTAAVAAAGAAAGDVAVAAAVDVAVDAAGTAAWDAAGDVARAAAWDAAWDAARDAARDKLAPTVALLQDSAIVLYDAMIRGEWPEAA
jgi:hypothetical protein